MAIGIMTKAQQLLHLLALVMAAVACISLKQLGVSPEQTYCGPDHNGNKCSGYNCCNKYGYCGTGDLYCGSRSGCRSDYGHKCTNVDQSCFPGDAVVLTPGGIEKPISELSIGEEVAVWIGKDGELQYDVVYAYGHAESEPFSEFIAITIHNANATQYKLQLTSDHFVLVVTSKGNMEYKKAKDVVVGDTMMAFNEQGHDFLVIGLEKEMLRGLFNPFTMRGTILVNNVVASCHSRWFLDSTFERIGVSHLLPSTYQAFLAPIRVIYKKIGIDAYKSLYSKIDSHYNIPKSGSSFIGYLSLLGHVLLFEDIIDERIPLINST